MSSPNILMPTDENNKRLAVLEEYRHSFWPQSTDSHVLLTLAESYLIVDHLEQAIELLERAIDKDPQFALAHIRLAETSLRIGRSEAAALSFAAASQCDSEDKFDAAYQAYEVVEAMPEHSKALEVLRQICARFPNDEYFVETLAEFSHRYGDYTEAERIYRSILAGDLPPEKRLDLEWRLSGVLIASGNYAEGFPLIERVLPRLGSEYDLEYIERELADDYLKAGRFESALEIYLHRADAFLPGESRAQMLRKAAKCYEGLRKHDEAIKCLIEILTFVREVGSSDDTWVERMTVASNPHFYEDIYAALTRCYEAKGDFVCAKECFKKEKEYYAKAIASLSPAKPANG